MRVQRIQNTSTIILIIKQKKICRFCGALRCFFCSRICSPKSRMLGETAQISMKFDAIFTRDTRPAPSETMQKSQEGVARPATTCALLLRTFVAPCARVRRRNCAVFRLKFARFCVQIFEFSRASGRKCTCRPIQKHGSSLRGRFKTCAAFAELCGVACRAFCRKDFRFSR